MPCAEALDAPPFQTVTGCHGKSCQSAAGAPARRRVRDLDRARRLGAAADGLAAKGRKKARGSLIFANGRGDFIEKYLEAYAHWHGRGWNVTAFDWRGQGGSRGAGFGYESFDLLIDDLAALLADWREGNPGPHVAIGHSMGGHLLLRTWWSASPISTRRCWSRR